MSLGSVGNMQSFILNMRSRKHVIRTLTKSLIERLRMRFDACNVNTIREARSLLEKEFGMVDCRDEEEFQNEEMIGEIAPKESSVIMKLERRVGNIRVTTWMIFEDIENEGKKISMNYFRPVLIENIAFPEIKIYFDQEDEERVFYSAERCPRPLKKMVDYLKDVGSALKCKVISEPPSQPWMVSIEKHLNNEIRGL